MRKRDEEFLTPDLTPLIDVVFLLLIFFLVSSVFKKQELALLLNLPESETSGKVQTDKKDITIELNNGEIALNGKKISIESLGPALKALPKKSLINIRSDKKTLYYKVIEILDILKNNQLTNVNLVTQQ